MNLSTDKELSLVLIGPSDFGKSHTGNNLLDLSEKDRIFGIKNPQKRASRVSVAIRAINEFDIVVVDTPSLSTHVMFNEEVFREIEKCAFFPDMRPRPIGVVLRSDKPLNQQELDCIQFIMRKLPDNFPRFVFVGLYSRDSIFFKIFTTVSCM